MNSHESVVANEVFPKQYGDEFLVIESGSGVQLQDISGKTYLDFAGGIAVNALGYGRRDLAEVIRDQAEKLIHISNLFTTAPAQELGKKLCSASPLKSDQPWKPGKNPGYFKAVHLGNSGTEANEAALKYARAYQKRKGKENAFRFLAFENSFHGRTMGALSVTHTEKYRKPFTPLIEGATFAPYNDVAALEEVLNEDFAAVIVEVVQGEGGLYAMTEEFAAALNRICREKDIVLIADEVQTGLGRTGTLFASEYPGLEPDIITLSKPLAAGLPLSATLLRPDVADAIHPGDHASTFGGGPVTTAAASYVWDAITKPGFLAGVAENADYLGQRLEALQERFPDFFTKEAPRGRGMLRGICLADADKGPAVLAGAREKGLLILRAGSNVLRFAPPLVIEKSDIDEMENILNDVIGSL